MKHNEVYHVTKIYFPYLFNGKKKMSTLSKKKPISLVKRITKGKEHVHVL